MAGKPAPSRAHPPRYWRGAGGRGVVSSVVQHKFSASPKRQVSEVSPSTPCAPSKKLAGADSKPLSGGLSGAIRAECKSPTILSVLFWNSRGLRDKFAEVCCLMETSQVSLGVFCETRLCLDKLTHDGWKYEPGSEHVPAASTVMPKLGLGMARHLKSLPDPSVCFSGEFTMWTRFPGKGLDLFVCGVYVPDGPSSVRNAAYKELKEGIVLLRDKGLLLIGGDFNARCAMNGDTVTNSNGTGFLKFANDNSLTIANSLKTCVPI